MSNVGCRIFTDINRPDKALIERFRGLPVANIGDNMNRIFCVDGRIRPMNRLALLGVAFTLHLPSGDNLLMHKSYELAQPGDVFVIASGGAERSYCGELMMMCAKNKGLAGIAVDGSIRDAEETARMDFPVFARSITPQGPYKNGPGEVNVPIAFGGQVVFPGDIVVGDQDGLIFIRPHEAEEILEKSWRQNEKERKLFDSYTKGGTDPSFNKEMMDRALEAAGCEIVQGAWHH